MPICRLRTGKINTRKCKFFVTYNLILFLPNYHDDDDDATEDAEDDDAVKSDDDNDE